MTVGLLGLRSVATPKHYPTEECRIGTFHDSGLTTAVFASARKTRSETNYSGSGRPLNGSPNTSLWVSYPLTVLKLADMLDCEPEYFMYTM